MHYLIEDTVMEELERATCRLESMGTILSSLCGPDKSVPEMSSLSDLGSLISRQAMDILNLLAEKEHLRPAPLRVVNDDHTCQEESGPRIWFVPEVPSD